MRARFYEPGDKSQNNPVIIWYLCMIVGGVTEAASNSDVCGSNLAVMVNLNLCNLEGTPYELM